MSLSFFYVNLEKKHLSVFSSLFLEFIEAFMRLNSVPRGRGPFGQSLQNSMLRKKDQYEGNLLKGIDNKTIKVQFILKCPFGVFKF